MEQGQNRVDDVKTPIQDELGSAMPDRLFDILQRKYEHYFYLTNVNTQIGFKLEFETINKSPM